MQERVAETASTVTTAESLRRRKPQPRSQAKRQKILDASTRHFAEHGYQATRVEDIAQKLGIAKGSIFQHFGSKEGLFLECYKKVVSSLPTYLEAPAEVLDKGFFSALRYWLEVTEGRIEENWVTYRLTVIGEYGTSMTLRKEINRFLDQNDPYGVSEFIRMGIERGEVREDIEPAALATTLHWMVERFQDACIAEELDPGFIRRGDAAPPSWSAVDQYFELIRSAFARR